MQKDSKCLPYKNGISKRMHVQTYLLQLQRGIESLSVILNLYLRKAWNWNQKKNMEEHQKMSERGRSADPALCCCRWACWRWCWCVWRRRQNTGRDATSSDFSASPTEEDAVAAKAMATGAEATEGAGEASTEDL